MSKYRALTQIFPSSFTAHTSAKILQKHKYWKKSGTSKKFQDAVDLMIKFLQKHLYTLHGRSSQGGNRDTLDITGASSGNRLGSDTTRLASCGVIPFSHSENMDTRAVKRVSSGERLISQGNQTFFSAGAPCRKVQQLCDLRRRVPLEAGDFIRGFRFPSRCVHFLI